MPTVISTGRGVRESIPDILTRVFPDKLCCELEKLYERNIPVDEVRIRADKRACVTSANKNIYLPIIISRRELDAVVDNICEGSLYAHAESISSGYITLDGGIRIGIVGRASVSNGRIVGVYDISGLCVRLPRRITSVGSCICRLLRDSGRGVLIYSPPGQGKTTLLRSVSAAMSSGDKALRVSVIDSRGELGYALESSELCIDVLVGYPRPIGIEICARSMNSQLIVCDEIGTLEEARAIIAAQNCGVPLLATAHAADIRGLLRRTGIALLHEAGVFGAYVGIERVEGKREYKYTVDMADDIEL